MPVGAEGAAWPCGDLVRASRVARCTLQSIICAVGGRSRGVLPLPVLLFMLLSLTLSLTMPLTLSFLLSDGAVPPYVRQKGRRLSMHQLR